MEIFPQRLHYEMPAMPSWVAGWLQLTVRCVNILGSSSVIILQTMTARSSIIIAIMLEVAHGVSGVVVGDCGDEWVTLKEVGWRAKLLVVIVMRCDGCTSLIWYCWLGVMNCSLKVENQIPGKRWELEKKFSFMTFIEIVISFGRGPFRMLHFTTLI